MTVTDDTGTEIDPDAFVQWVHDHPNNILGLELSEALAECVEATQLLGRKSRLTFQVGIELGESFFGELLITSEITSKPAKPRPEARPFFPTPNGGLSRRDPSQPQIPGMDNE